MVLEPAKENPPVVAGLGAADVAAGAGAPNENEGLGADAVVADDEANATLANGLAFLGGVFSAPLDACDDVDVGIVVDGCAARVVEAKGLEGAAGFGELPVREKGRMELARLLRLRYRTFVCTNQRLFVSDGDDLLRQVNGHD